MENDFLSKVRLIAGSDTQKKYDSERTSIVRGATLRIVGRTERAVILSTVTGSQRRSVTDEVDRPDSHG